MTFRIDSQSQNWGEAGEAPGVQNVRGCSLQGHTSADRDSLRTPLQMLGGA